MSRTVIGRNQKRCTNASPLVTIKDLFKKRRIQQKPTYTIHYVVLSFSVIKGHKRSFSVILGSTPLDLPISSPILSCSSSILILSESVRYLFVRINRNPHRISMHSIGDSLIVIPFICCSPYTARVMASKQHL